MRASSTERLLILLSKLRTLLFSKAIASQFHRYGSGTRVSPPFRFANLNHISLGDNVTINRDCWIHVLSAPNHTSDAPVITIQSNTGIGMGATISAVRSVIIGEHAMLARNVYISDHAHAYEDLQLPIALQGISGIADVVIGPSSWIGQNVCILPGVTIGRHCVIGANSVVNRSIPEFCVAAGSPAKIIRQYNPQTKVWEKLPPAT